MIQRLNLDQFLIHPKGSSAFKKEFGCESKTSDYQRMIKCIVATGEVVVCNLWANQEQSIGRDRGGTPANQIF